MDSTCCMETNDPVALAAFAACQEFFMITFRKGAFFTEATGGRKLLWVCRNSLDVAVICQNAYADRLDDLVVTSLERRGFMERWANNPTVDVSFVWGMEEGKDCLPHIASVSRRKVLQYISKMAESDKTILQRNYMQVLDRIDDFSLMGVLVPQHSDAIFDVPLGEYVYADGPSGLRYLRWLKDPDLMARYLKEHPTLVHAYKSIPDIIQCVECHGLGGLIIEREDGSAVLTAADLFGLLWATRETAPLFTYFTLDEPYYTQVHKDWLDWTRELTFTDCGFNLHTENGASFGALLMYCIVDNYCNQDPRRIKIYQQLGNAIDIKDISGFFNTLAMLSAEVAVADNALPSATRVKINAAAEKASQTGCDIHDFEGMSLCDSVPFYEENYHLYTIVSLDHYAEIIRQGMLHLGDSEKEIEYYVNYAKSHLPYLINEWAASVSLAALRKTNLTMINEHTIHDAIAVVEKRYTSFSVGRTIHEGYKLLVQVYRGDAVINKATSDVAQPVPTIYVDIPDFSHNEPTNKKVLYTPLSKDKASEGFLYDLDVLFNEMLDKELDGDANAGNVLFRMDDMPHAKLNKESLCTYIMSSGRWFTFRVLDMIRAERSIYTYCLTCDNPYGVEEVNMLMHSFYTHPDLLMECGMNIMGVESTEPIVVFGYTARDLQRNTNMSLFKCYLCLITLRDNPDSAIEIVDAFWKDNN